MARILGLDVGERRIGIAISDPDERLAVPLRILDERNEERATAAIAAIATAERIATLVVGLPLSLDGTAGQQAQRVRAFARRLAAATGIPLELWDERLTSVQAGRLPPPERKRRSRQPARTREPADDIAAAIILQAFLDRRRSRAAATEA